LMTALTCSAKAFHLCRKIIRAVVRIDGEDKLTVRA